MYIPEHAYPTPALNVPPSPQVVATPEPSSWLTSTDNQDSWVRIRNSPELPSLHSAVATPP